ncbi:hypothetical protein ACN28S_13650 [Cystobacter fuscus]
MKMQSKVLVVAAMGAALVASASALSRQPTFAASVGLLVVSLMGVWATLHGQPLRRAYGLEEEGMGLGEFARWTPASPGAGYPRAVEDGGRRAAGTPSWRRRSGSARRSWSWPTRGSASSCGSSRWCRRGGSPPSGGERSISSRWG